MAELTGWLFNQEVISATFSTLGWHEKPVQSQARQGQGDVYVRDNFTRFVPGQARYHLHRKYHHGCSWTRSETLQRTWKADSFIQTATEEE